MCVSTALCMELPKDYYRKGFSDFGQLVTTLDRGLEN